MPSYLWPEVPTCGTATSRQREGAAHRTRTTPLSSSNAGSTSSAKSGNAGAPSKKSAGGQKRSNLTFNTKMDVLEHLGKKVKPSAVAEKFGISDRTVRQLTADVFQLFIKSGRMPRKLRSSWKTDHKEEERRASRDHNTWRLVRSVLRAVVQQYCSIFSFVQSTSRTAVPLFSFLRCTAAVPCKHPTTLSFLLCC